jgi:MinD-like ATPase involved in chromosome partitioning or flagellar assembly
LDDDTKTKVVIFASPCGGVGTSTMAAACAMHFAAQGKRTLYLNLEKFGSSDVFFSAGGNFCMGDVIFALKSKRTNFSLRLESCVKQDSNGVFFYSQSKNALEMFELSNEEMKRLISELKSTGSYDYIVIDTDIAMDTEGLEIYRLAHSFVWVGDGSEISNSKIRRAYSALSIRDEDSDSPLINRICLVYNMFSNKTGIGVNDLGLRNIGGAPRYTHASTKEILAQLVSKDIFDKIF